MEMGWRWRGRVGRCNHRALRTSMVCQKYRLEPRGLTDTEQMLPRLSLTEGTEAQLWTIIRMGLC